MAELKIKLASGSSAPSYLEARTLGMCGNDLYYGGTADDKKNQPIKVLDANKITYIESTQTLKIDI